MHEENQPLEILLVAADSDVRENCRDLLTMYTSGDRFAFVEAETGQAGLDCFDPATHACVVATDALPDLTIEAFLERLSERSSRAVTVVIGLGASEDARERALAAGAAAYLSPATLGPKTLSHAVFDALARAEAARQAQTSDAHEAIDDADTPPTHPEMAYAAATSPRAPLRPSRPELAIPVECVYDRRRMNGTVDELSRSGARVQGLTALPAVGATLTLRLYLLDGAPPLEIPSHVTEHATGNTFSVAFDSIDRRKRELLRVVTAKHRRPPPA